MTDINFTPDMSTPESITDAFAQIRDHGQDTEPQAGMRTIDYEILRILEEAGVKGVEAIKAELSRVKSDHSGEPLYGNIGEIGDTYGEDADTTTDDPVEAAKLRRIEGIAHAVSDITLAAFAGAAGNNIVAAETLRGREEALDDIGDDEEAEITRAALEGIIGNMIDALPTGEG